MSLRPSATLWRRISTWGRRFWAALRVLRGKNASIPVGEYASAIGVIKVRDYYGGCVFTCSCRQADIYWTHDKLDGWGARSGQAKFDEPASVGAFDGLERTAK